MSKYLISRTPSPEPSSSKTPPVVHNKCITLPVWLWNRCNDPVSKLHEYKNEWLKGIEKSMTATGHEKLHGHIDDLEIYINHIVELNLALWNAATIHRNEQCSFYLEPELTNQLDKIPASAYTWLRYIKTTWRPIINSKDLASVFHTVNRFAEFAVELNSALARIYPE